MSIKIILEEKTANKMLGDRRRRKLERFEEGKWTVNDEIMWVLLLICLLEKEKKA